METCHSSSLSESLATTRMVERKASSVSGKFRKGRVTKVQNLKQLLDNKPVTIHNIDASQPKSSTASALAHMIKVGTQNL